jgi:hypothetical protein
LAAVGDAPVDLACEIDGASFGSAGGLELGEKTTAVPARSSSERTVVASTSSGIESLDASESEMRSTSALGTSRVFGISSKKELRSMRLSSRSTYGGRMQA